MSNLPVPQKYSPEQDAFINYFDSPVLLIAGAGSGKTHCIVGRLNNILLKGVPPESILLLTFTNRAAQSMIARAKALNESAANITAGTFHSIFYRLLVEYGAQTGHYKGESVLNDYQQQRIWDKSYETVFDEGMRGHIERLKLGGLRRIKALYSKIITSSNTYDNLKDAYEDYPELRNWDSIRSGGVAAVFEYYHRFKLTYNGIDFDDILLKMSRLVEEPWVLKRLQDKFQHIVVDEYQDTSWLQAKVLRAIVGTNPNIAVVGDPNQSIYSFLSAYYKNILEFKNQYPGGIHLSLRDNYRSNQWILDMANKLMHSADEAIYNPLIAKGSAEDIKPTVHKYASDKSEADGVLRDIQKAIANGTPLHEIAILSRASMTTRSIESALANAGLSYVKYGGLKLTAKTNIKQFLAFLELVLNPQNWLAWEILLPMIPMIGDKLSNQVVQDLQGIAWDWSNPPPVSLGSGKRYRSFMDFWDILKRIDTLKTVDQSAFMRSAFIIFTDLYNYYWNGMTADAQQELIKEDMDPDLDKKADQLKQRLEEVETYIVNLAEHRNEELSQFLSQYALDDSAQAEQEQTKDAIVVSTIHSAKGLEWDVVFVVGIEEGTLPPAPRSFGKNLQDERGNNLTKITEKTYIAEERRLFYVAMTRARKELHLCTSSMRLGQGMKDSRFISEYKPSRAFSGLTELLTHNWVLEKMRDDYTPKERPAAHSSGIFTAASMLNKTEQ